MPALRAFGFTLSHTKRRSITFTLPFYFFWFASSLLLQMNFKRICK